MGRLLFFAMGGNASKVGFEAIVKQLTTKDVNATDYEVSQFLIEVELSIFIRVFERWEDNNVLTGL